MKKFRYSILLLFLAFVLTGCIKISHRITTSMMGQLLPVPLSSGEPMQVAGAVIYVEGFDQTVRTDEYGRFVFTTDKSAYNRIVTAVQSTPSYQIVQKSMGDIRNNAVVTISPATTIAVEAVLAISPHDRTIFDFQEIVDLAESSPEIMEEVITHIGNGQNHLLNPVPLIDKLASRYFPFDIPGTLRYIYTHWNGEPVEEEDEAPEIQVVKTGIVNTLDETSVYQVIETFNDRGSSPIENERWYGIADGRVMLYSEDPSSPGDYQLSSILLALRYHDSARKETLERDLVDTQAGIFDALKVIRRHGNETHISWYAPAIGLVRRDEYIGDVLNRRIELVSFN